jgi:UDPglucose 6-dehydrogenase
MATVPPDDTLTLARLAVIGCGPVGLVTAACFADRGHAVIAVDSDHAKVRTLEQGRVPLYEPGLEDLVRGNLQAGRLRFTADIPEAVQPARIVFVCVGTPSHPDGRADLGQVESVARSLATCLDGYKVIVEKSTVPVRTAERIERTIRLYARADCAVDVASNPEFMREGSAIHDFLHTDRIVIGAETPRARAALESLYKGFGCPILVTDVHTAELIKHAANAFLATKISFINMIADLSEATGADVTLVARGMGLDHRIGETFLQAGVGYGGSCFPKDLRALVRLGDELGADVGLLRAVQQINEARVQRLLHKLREALWVVRDKAIAVLGLSFKFNTDDIREAPSLRIIRALLDEGARLVLYDPRAISNMRRVFPEDGAGLRYCTDPYLAAEGADALLLLTEWDEIRALDLPRIRRLMRTPIVVDGRNIYDPDVMHSAGLEYYSLGRPAAVTLPALVRQPNAVGTSTGGVR